MFKSRKPSKAIFFSSVQHSGGEFQGFDLRLNKEVLWNLTGVYATHAFTQRALRVIADHDKTKVRKGGSAVVKSIRSMQSSFLG